MGAGVECKVELDLIRYLDEGGVDGLNHHLARGGKGNQRHGHLSHRYEVNSLRSEGEVEIGQALFWIGNRGSLHKSRRLRLPLRHRNRWAVWCLLVKSY